MNRELLVLPNAIKHPLCAAISLLCAGVMPGVHAQPPQQVLEEVVVTAQKRVQSLQEVPISVAAVTGDKIEKMGVENLEDLTSYVPNIHFTETGLSTQMRIRGIGSDNSQGFEQSVGVYKDGIYHSRAQLYRAPVFDVERVEIMRGPQGTLFGKNSIAGAIDIIAAKPTNELEGKITGSYETEFETREVSGYVSGPLSDTLQGRLALRYYDDPGYITNTFKNRAEPSVEEQSVRGSLAWQPAENVDVLFIAERDTFDVQGRPMEISQDIPAVGGTPFTGLTYSQILAAMTGGLTFDNRQNYERQIDAPEFSDNTINTQTLRIDYETEHFTLTSLSGVLGYDYRENCDCDYTPVHFFELGIDEEYDQFSQEIRLISPEGETVEWLAGVFYQTYDQSFSDDFNVPVGTPLVPLVQAAISRLQTAYPGAGFMYSANFPGSTIARRFEQGSDAWAAFAEGTWNATEKLKVTFGARFTEERKDAEKELNIVNTGTGALINDPILANFIYAAIFETDTQQSGGHNLDESRDESAFTPSLTIAFQANADVMTYVKASKGFKAGGFDPRSNDRDRFEFEEETVTALELGSKLRLAEGRAELNVAVFHMDYEDLQVSQFDGAVGFNVGNAESTLVQGIEIDGRWRLADHWTSSYGVAVLDFEYEDFTNGNCHFGQTPDTTVAGDRFCDYSGQRGVYTPELTLNAGLEYSRPVGSLEFVAGLDAQWVDEQQVHVNLDPRGEIDAYTMLDARVAIESETWAVALLGKNLLDEEIISYSANMPLSEAFFRTNTYYSFLRRPMTLALEATFRF